MTKIQHLHLNKLKLKKNDNELIRTLQTEHIQDIFSLPTNKGPYPGLRSFENDEAAIFFGRHKEIIEIIKLLNQISRGISPLINLF